MPEGDLKKSSESLIAAELREALGVGPDEPVTVFTPQFERLPTMSAPGAPPTDWEALRGMDKAALQGLGMGAWNDPSEPEDPFDGATLMVFPGEWYSSIPEGFEVTDINNQDEVFKPGVTDNDIRFGYLAFGVKVKS
ncbi:MAG: hypothetical protein AMXMBFR56_62080 [Polyangiaceae bacterium]